jgi:hypothetical protein
LPSPELSWLGSIDISEYAGVQWLLAVLAAH